MGDSALEANLAKTMAAESIQAVFRRYMECKELMKIRKMRSTEKLVKNLAAETITKGLRSLSRSRSRIQSETSSFHQSEIQSLASRSIAEPPAKERAIELKAGSRVLQISELLVENVFGVVWQGKNNLFCTLRLKDWEHKTVTVPEAADAASWLDETIDLPIQNDGHDHTKPLGSLVVSIFHENLVVTDKLIGQVDIPLISIFEGDVSSPQYTCEASVPVEQTAFDGTKFKRKAKGVVKFAARIINGKFNPADSRTKRVDAVTPPRLKEDTLEIRLDSISGSLITHSIDPDNMREDSMYDFSSTQLRDAVHLLQEWEAPPASAAASVKTTTAGKGVSNVTSRSSSQPPSRPISRPSSTKNVLHPNTATFFADPASQKPARDNTTKPPTPTAAASSSQKSVAAASQVPPVTAAPAPPAPRRTIRTESRSLAGTELTEDNPAAAKDPLSLTAPTTTRPISASATAGSSNSKTATRLRNRRSSADDSAVRRKSIESGTSKKLKPATDLMSIKSGTSAHGATRAMRSRYGEHVIDEAFRLSIKAKGAFLKLKISELANLLDFLNFPVNSELLDGSELISNLNKEGTVSSVTAATKACRSDSQGAEVVSIPIVHAMSLAATISFLVRDHNLLNSSTRGGSVDGISDPAGAPVGVMNEERSERVLAQLVGMVEGSYPDAKLCILKACASERAPVKTSTSGNSALVVEPRRPALWSPSLVRDFLRTICVTHAPDLELTGQQLLALDGTALRSHFSANPSIDRARLSVYLQTLQYLDTWWERGIRPGEIYHKESLDSEDPSVKSGTSDKRNKSKRRGSKAGYDPVSAKWGDLSLVLDSLKDNEFSGAGQVRSKVVDGGRAIQSHLLKIADFQVLLEALNPLNRAFGWGCSLEGLVRFASIVGGMRGHLWVQDDSLIRTIGSNNSSFADLSQLSGGLDEAKASAQDEIGRWVVLQKGSANSTSELTQLVRLCQELRVVMKYTSREDDFIAFIPLPCLRITSVQEVRAGAFQAALEGLLLDDISVGKKVVVAGIDALVRTCERFEWWDRPSVQVLESMSNQVGEVVSLVEAQSKRRVGVRLYGSGICDALPLESLRLCTDDEYNHAIESIEAKRSASREASDAEGGAPATKPVRRKSRANINGNSRKTRLRTLIKTLNDQDDEQVKEDKRARATTPPIAPPSKTFTSRLSSKERIFDEGSNKSELSNLSGDELTPPPMRASPSKKKKSAPVSPQKKLTKRVMVRNDPLALSKSNDPADEENEEVRVIESNYSRSAATSAVVKTRTESPTDQSLWSEVEPPVIDYSWLKNVPRSPIDFTQEVPAVGDQNLPDSPPAPAETKRHTPDRKPAGGAPLHIIQAGFDADRAEYTTGVPKIRLDDSGAEVEAARNNRHQPKYLRGGNRPQSAPSTGGRNKKNTEGKTAVKEQPTPMQSAEARTSFGLSGMGYVGNGQLKQHPNQWVNEDILPISEAEVPRVIPNKTPIHHTDFRSSTNKLFEFNKRSAAEVEQAASGNHFGNAGDVMKAQNEAMSPPRRTTTVPARPRSANPTGRGVSNPLNKQTLAEALGGEFVFPGEDVAASGEAGRVPAKSPVKRTREEELRHIAAAKSAKEMSLKEKVLMKELKRLQKNEK